MSGGAGAAEVDSDLPLPFKLDALPDMGLITRHFAPSERSWVKVEDGFVSVSVPKGIKPRVITVDGSMDAEAEAAESEAAEAALGYG